MTAQTKEQIRADIATRAGGLEAFEKHGCAWCRGQRAAREMARKPEKIALYEKIISQFVQHSRSCPKAAGIGPCGCGLDSLLGRLSEKP